MPSGGHLDGVIKQAVELGIISIQPCAWLATLMQCLQVLGQAASFYKYCCFVDAPMRRKAPKSAAMNATADGQDAP
jgi:hypothetical protein